MFYAEIELVVVGLYPPSDEPQVEVLFGLLIALDEVVVLTDKAEVTLVLARGDYFLCAPFELLDI